MEFQDIERERQKMKIPVAKLCGAAGLTVRTYERIKDGTRTPRPDTLARLASGLTVARRQGRPAAAWMERRSQVLFRIILLQLADESQADQALVLEFDPQAKATASKEWMEISRLRHLAMYIMNVILGVPNADVAKAAGVSPAAVTVALQKMEIKRDDPDLDRLFESYARTVS